MTYYNSIDRLKNDFKWINKDCTLDHFSSSKLSEYKYKNLFKQIVQRVDNPFVENLFNQLLSELNLQSSAWEDALTSPMLPALALIPGVGMSIVIDIDVNGVYKTIGENGTNALPPVRPPPKASKRSISPAFKLPSS